MSMLAYGLITGFLFGFFLQKGRVLRYDIQMGALRLMDMTIFKFMLSAIIVGMVGIYLLKDFGLANLRVIPLAVGPNIIGGLIFGAGWGFLGYCPGTAGGALGEGRWDSLWGIIGMLFGAGLYAVFFPFLRTSVLTWGRYDIYTFPQLFGINHWFVIPVFIAIIITAFIWFEKKGL